MLLATMPSIFWSPLHAGVRLDLLDFQQAENYAVGLLRRGGYQLFNPCFDLPLFLYHIFDLRPNQGSMFFSNNLSSTRPQ
jgi:hypothetical protein